MTPQEELREMGRMNSEGEALPETALQTSRVVNRSGCDTPPRPPHPVSVEDAARIAIATRSA